MNETIKTLTERRSVRKYTDKLIDKESLDLILKAGVYAPTGRNSRDTLFLVVTQKELRDRLSKMNAAVMGNENDPFYGAPCVIVVLADRSVIPTTYMNDGSLVIGNMLLAAHSLGLGACWVHRAKEVFETEEGRAILRDLGIEGDLVGIGNCIIGYPDGDYPVTRPRKENYIYRAE